MKTQLKKLLLAAATCLTAGPLLAQSAVDGAIGGTVVDTSGSVIPRATIVVHSNTTNAEQTVMADDSGFFRAIHLQPSTYTVMITAPGFATFKSSDVLVQVGLLTDIAPKLAVGSTQQTVEVTSEVPAINSTTPEFSGLISQRVLQDLPVNNYRWSSYAALTPGVVVDSNGFGLLSFRGQSTLLNNVTIDGADETRPTSPRNADAPARATPPPRPRSRSFRSTPLTTPSSTAVQPAASSTPSPRAAATSSTANSTSMTATPRGVRRTPSPRTPFKPLPVVHS